MVDDAERLGANAVVGVRFTTVMVASDAAEIMCYSTEVVCSRGVSTAAVSAAAPASRAWIQAVAAAALPSYPFEYPRILH